MFRDSAGNRMRSWLLAGLLTGAMLGLSNCSDDQNSGAAANKNANISLNRTSRYDPNMAGPGDTRPTVPPTDAIAPEMENDTGNSGILVPANPASAGAIGGAGHR